MVPVPAARDAVAAWPGDTSRLTAPGMPYHVTVLYPFLPLAAVTSSYAQLHRVMLAGGLIALAVAFGIGIFVAGRVTRPVIEMQAIAHQMSEGQFAVRAPVRSMPTTSPWM